MGSIQINETSFIHDSNLLCVLSYILYLAIFCFLQSWMESILKEIAFDVFIHMLLRRGL